MLTFSPDSSLLPDLVPLPESSLSILQTQYQNELSGGLLSTQSAFNYAYGLIRSDKESEVKRGLKILGDIYEKEDDRKRECLFYLALGSGKVGNFQEGISFVSLLLTQEPANTQAQELRRILDDSVKREAVVGLSILGAAGAAIGVIALGLFMGSRRR